MAHIIVLGGGIGGVSCAYELKQAVRREDRVTLVSNRPFFQFTPSNPWVAVKWRTKNDVIIDLASVLPKHGIAFSAAGASRVYAAENRVELGDGTSIPYDYLVVATGPELAFDEIEGLGPERNTYSVCDVDHATAASVRWEEFCKNPGPIVVGAVQGASCYGPAYEFAMIMDADLRKPAHPRQGADNLRHRRALYRPSRRWRRRRYEGNARIRDAPASHQMDC